MFNTPLIHKTKQSATVPAVPVLFSKQPMRDELPGSSKLQRVILRVGGLRIQYTIDNTLLLSRELRQNLINSSG